MIPILILALSILALCQFGVYLWRAAMISVAAEVLLNEMDTDDRGPSSVFAKRDFQSLAAVHDICPQFERPSLRLQFVRAYFRAVELLGSLSEESLPAVADWAKVEMEVCTRCMAVMVDHRLRSTQAHFAEVSSF
jgi:hypothetical protein